MSTTPWIDMQQGIIVLGMARSGTSLLTEVIHRCGAAVGDPLDLKRADAQNPQGYWEYQPLRLFNQELLASVGASEEFPPADQTLLRLRASESPYRDRALALLATMQLVNRAWVWKDPLLPTVLGFWEKLWGNALYIIAVRNPVDMALSHQKWLGDIRFTVPASLLFTYWQYLMCSALDHTEGTDRKLFVQYEELVAHPYDQCRRLYDFLNTHGAGGEAGDASLAWMIQAIDPALRHNRASIPFAESPEARPEQKRLYRLLQEKVKNPHAPYRQEEFPMPGAWRDDLQRAYESYKLATAAVGSQ
jgi:hypothetical protein